MKKIPEPRTPFRFVLDEADLNRNQAGCKNACEYALIMPSTYLMDFVFIRTAIANTMQSMTVSSEDGSHVISTAFDGTDLKDWLVIKSIGYYDYISFRGLMTGHFTGMLSMLSEPMRCGQYYYVRISDGVNNWTSEPIKPIEPYYVPEVTNAFVNGTFNTDLSGWTVSGAWAWSAAGGGRAKKTAGAPASLEQTVNQDPAIMQEYLDGFWSIEFDVFGSLIGVTGDLTVEFDDVLFGTASIVDLHSSQHVCISGNFQPAFLLEGRIKITGDASFDGGIDNVVVRPLSWELFNHSKLEWTDTCDIGHILNSNFQIVHRFWFGEGIELGEPQNALLEEGTQNGDRKFIPGFQHQVTLDQLESDLQPKYIVNALSDIGMYTTRKYVRPRNLGYSDIEALTISSSFEFDEKCMATVKLSMQLQAALIKTACCAPTPDLCPIACSSVSGFLPDTPVEGEFYVQDGNRNVIEFHAAGNIEIACVAEPGIPLVMFPDLSNYFYNGSVWLPVAHMLSGTNSEEGTVDYLGSTAFTLIAEISLAGFYADVYWSTDNVTYTLLGTYTQAQLNAGIAVDFGTTDFYISLYAKRFGCGPFRGMTHRVQLWRRFVLSYDDPFWQFGAGTWYHQLQDGSGAFHAMNGVDQIALDDEVALAAKLNSFGVTSLWEITDDGAGDMFMLALIDPAATYAWWILVRRADTSIAAANFLNYTRIFPV